MKQLLLSVALCFLVISPSLKSQTSEVNSTSHTQNFSSTPTHNKIVVGYYAQWAIYARDYNVLDIEADKLTHLMYAFFDTKYDANTDTAWIETLDQYADFDHNESGQHPNDATVKGNIGDLKLLKQQYPHLKILISLGGWTRSQAFPDLAKSENGRLTLAESMVNFMQTYTWIDGFDIDWEFPVEGGTDGNEVVNGATIPAQPHYPDDHKNLVHLLKKIREVFDANNMQNKLLTMAAGNNVSNLVATHVGPGTESTHGMTDNLFDYCDFVTFFGYDFGGNWFNKTCYNAPLYGGDHPEDPLNRGAGNPNQVMDGLVGLYLNDLQVPKDKLIMGIPFYGKLFEGVASTGVVSGFPGLYESAPRVNNSCALPQPPQGSWDVGTCENSGSIEFCDLFQGIATNVHHYLDANDPNLVSATAAASGWVRYWDDTAKVPYLYNATENKFISYDDPESIDLKVKYALSKELGGVMIWELSQDARQSDKGLLDVIDQTLLNSTYDIVLNFEDQNQVALQGVSVELKDEQGTVLETLTTDANGQVLFDDKTAYLPYTIIYSLSNYSFLPSSISFAASEFDSNKTIDILGSNQTSSISGSVKENGQLLPDVNVILKDSNDQELEKITSTDGNFSFNAVIDGYDYSITAEKDYYSFTTHSYPNLSSDQVNQEIIATRNTHNISGTITSSGSRLQGVSVSIVGNGQTYSETTDANGGYTANNIPAGYDYTVTPTLGSMVFKPTSRTFTLLNNNGTADFTENTGLIYGTVKDGTTPVSGATVSLVVPWTDNNHLHQNIKKTTNAQGEYFYTETELDGYNTIESLKLNAWENNNVTYYPTDLANISITATPQEFNFNAQPVKPEITINNPNTSIVNNTYGSSVALEALVALSYDDGTTTLNSVVFKLDGNVITHTNSSGVYSGTWSPTDSDYGNSHTFTVEAESSNSETATKSFDFTLNCNGTNCPNIAPKIVWNTPSNTTVNQNQGFQNIPIEVTVTDTDGTVASVTITIDGATHNMTSGTNNTYSYNFTPTNHQQYPLTITATDDDADVNTLAETLTITNSQFVPLPSGNIILGFAHSWENASAPFLYFNDMKDKKYNVIMYSFIETVNQNGYSPQLTINSNRYQTNGAFDSQLLKDDIQSLRDEGIPVIVSIGGQNGHVELSTVAQKDEFVQGLKDIVDEYGFDGIDLDFEGGSMNFGAGALTDFSYASISAYPKLKLVVDAFKEIKQHYGTGFILTCAPETFYVQVGYSTYTDTAGAFLPVIHNLRNELDLIMVQLYNTGSINALDGQAYAQATPDFLASMSDMLITGFNVASTGFSFPGLPASKIMVGIPSCPAAAPAGGYIQPSEAIKALDYLRFGTDFTGRNYTLQNNAHSDLRGVMTWSVNWDAAPGCASAYEFSNSYDDYFFGNLSNNDFEYREDNFIIYPNPFSGKLIIKAENGTLNSVRIFDVLGEVVFKSQQLDKPLDLEHLNSGLYIMEIKTDNKKRIYRKLIKK